MTAPALVVIGRANEAALAERWRAGISGPLRLEDGRVVRVIYPGGDDPGNGPDCPGAVLDIDGDLVRGDVEVHLRASGWRAHGHDADPAYSTVVLHVVEHNDSGQASTRHGQRLIPLLVLPSLPGAGSAVPGDAFVPPCALAAARTPVEATLERISLRRLRQKAVAAAPVRSTEDAGTALWSALVETLGGSANRAPFRSLARQLPLPALLERSAGHPDRVIALRAELRFAARAIVIQRAGLRPMAAPGARIEAAARLAARLWPANDGNGWPKALSEPVPVRGLLALLKVEGLGRGTAIELATNAVLPIALAASIWPQGAIEETWRQLPSPGTYGRLRRLEGWLGSSERRPFATAARLQGGLLLHRDYCTQGRCGRCPLSAE